MTDDKIEFPILNTLDSKTLQSTHRAIQITPDFDKNLAYSLLLPNSWKVMPVPTQELKSGKPTILGLFSDDEGATASVLYTQFPFEISPKDFALEMADANKAKTIFCKERSIGLKYGADLGCLKDDEIIRFVCFVDSKGFFSLSTSSPKNRYPSLAQDFAIAVASIRLEKPLGNQFLELMVETKAQDNDFLVYHPSSWKRRTFKSQSKAKSVVDLALIEGKNFLSYVRIKSMDATDVGGLSDKDLLDQVSSELVESGVKISGVWSNDEDRAIRAYPGFRSAFTSEGRVKHFMCSLRCCIVARGKRLFVISSVYPTKGDEPIVWMRANRAFQIAVGSVRPG